jgi:gliding motility-associated-like protein
VVATDNNGSCTYPAANYLTCDGSCINDADADGVCDENEVPGCTDALACNYDTTATDENATCTYPATGYLNCDGSCINDTDGDGVCDENEVPGCLDPTACNYDATATDSGTCSYTAPALIIGAIQNESCSQGLGSIQVLNFDQFDSLQIINQNQVIVSNSTILNLVSGNYLVVGMQTASCVSDTVNIVIAYNGDCIPVAVNDSLIINEDAGLTQLNLLNNDLDGDNNLDVTSVDIDPITPGNQTTSSGIEGDWSVDGTGMLSFTPAPNYFGVATRLYVVSDLTGLISNQAVIHIEVLPVNDAPVISPETLTIDMDVNQTTTICFDVTDVDGDAVFVNSWMMLEGLGMIDDNILNDYCFDFTALGWQIPTSIMVVMCDNGSPSLCDTSWVTINVHPLKPIAFDDHITSNDGLVNIDVALNDSLFGDENFVISIIDSTDFGRVDLDTSLISYQPDWSYCGLDSMTYSLCNSFGMCDTATVYFEVTPVDSDLDGIPDYIETTTLDVDGDGIFNHLDDDSDGDGLKDSEESGMTELCSPTLSDCNGNGIPDYIDFNNCIPDLEIPEGFSPNGDGVNDSWVIPGIENYPGNSVVIYNRWGNQVYSAEPYDNAWNGQCNESGTIGGQTLPEGTYFFVFKSERNATAKQGYIYIKR